jgi:Arc/MetJ-type ribon-helix-helix transcriptional regulator
MKKQTVIPRKKRGPPATGKGEPIVVRMHPPMLAWLDKWIAKQKQPFPSRPEAVRRLVKLGLAVPSDRAPRLGRSLDLGQMAKLTPAPKATRLSRARELATEAIDELHDPAASTQERDERRRRLTKGPPEFREDRVDLPKAKGK